jgi:hypothetical protein
LQDKIYGPGFGEHRRAGFDKGQRAEFEFASGTAFGVNG